MATAKELRARMIECAKHALESEPTDIEARARRFVAGLAGSMSFLGETEIERLLDQVVGLENPGQPPADGA